MQEAMTRITCTLCDYAIDVESPRRFWGGYKLAPHPDDWKQVEDDWLCPVCKGEYLKLMIELRHRRKDKRGR